jgi:hypothetical protein
VANYRGTLSCRISRRHSAKPRFEAIRHSSSTYIFTFAKSYVIIKMSYVGSQILAKTCPPEAAKTP